MTSRTKHLYFVYIIQMLNIAILGYSSDLVGCWDPDTCETGLPGSEESIVYSSQVLADRGHNVKIFMNPSYTSKYRSPDANPRWFSDKDFLDHDEIFDLLLLWRRFDVDAVRKRAKKIFLWLHDSPPILPIYPPPPKADGVLFLSKHHRNQFEKWPKFNDLPYTISGNGVVLNQFATCSDINPYSIGYFSNYSRGLEILLYIWPDIKKNFPKATLSICYGRETWGTMSLERLNGICNIIEKYKELGVTEYGKIGHQRLANIMINTSIWAYPCTTLSETFCITAVKCQLAGCIPVINNIAALFETVHFSAPHTDNIRSMDDIEKYRELLLKTLTRVEEEDIALERQKYKDFAKTFTWSNCVDKWLKLYQQV